MFNRILKVVIVVNDKAQRMVLRNSPATNSFRCSISEALELSVEALVPEHLKAQHRAGIARYSEHGHGSYMDWPRSLELPTLRKDGEGVVLC